VTSLRALLVTCALSLGLAPASGFAETDREAGTERCRECHDYAPIDHVERLLMGSHGISEEAGFQRGCEDCHGASAAHAEAPREIPPATSFGPRWSATSAAQDSACLACHEENTAADWQHALHMLNDLTCVLCHDIHAEEDRVLLPEKQASVCTGCHQAQTKGIHGRQAEGQQDPPCSACHNPHNHESAAPQMQANQSAGCRHCHAPEDMADDPLASGKAVQYHQALQRPEHTCLECHQGVAHEAGGPAPLRPEDAPILGN
jgi:predicted CXXCH cytochrome family protein